MKRFAIIGFILFVLFTTSFLLAEQYGLTEEAFVREQVDRLHERPGGMVLAGALVVAVLALDLLLPVPSSVVMTVSGLLFGVWLGAALSFAGAMGSAAFGFLGCRWGGQRVFQRLAGNDDISRIDAWFERYGLVAIIVSRPVPMLTEVLSCLAGLTDIPVRTFFVVSALGTFPVCLVYAWFGAVSSPANPWPAVLVALLLPASGWLVARAIKGASHREPGVASEDRPA